MDKGGESMAIDRKKRMEEINANLTFEERSANVKRGQAKRRKTLAKKKKMKETLDFLLSLPLNDPKARKTLEDMGIDVNNQNNQTLMLAVAMQQAQKGNMRAVEYITEMMGENGAQKLSVEGKIPIVITGGDDLED